MAGVGELDDLFEGQSGEDDRNFGKKSDFEIMVDKVISEFSKPIKTESSPLVKNEFSFINQNEQSKYQ